jgi:hypothetical protein
MELTVKIGDARLWYSNNLVSIRQAAHRIHHADIGANAHHFHGLNIVLL